MNDTRSTTSAPAPRSRYANGVLTLIALFLGLIALQLWTDGPRETAASAQHPSASEQVAGIPNAADQRRRMIAGLDNIEKRLQKIESKLTSGAIDVKVISMPASKSSD